MSLLIQLMYFLFVVAAIVLIVVVLLQEGKGGGFGQALGTSGQETFGAGARGINTFTAVVAGVFLGSAMLIHVLQRLEGGSTVLKDDGGVLDAPVEPGSSAPPPPAGGTPNQGG